MGRVLVRFRDPVALVRAAVHSRFLGDARP
jgi:hypothetical protein